MRPQHVPAGAQSAWAEHVPVLWVEPELGSGPRRLALFLPRFGSSKEAVVPFLRDLAGAGFVALSFDAWQHGERGSESDEAITARVFAAFRRRMWPILGQTTLDVLRVVDWAVATLQVDPVVRVGGLSMGGDIAVAAAAIDGRIQRVAAVVATPDWLRPGMHDAFDRDKLVDPGHADGYAQYLYDEFNPATHPGRYGRGIDIRFLCGGNDNHVPPSGAIEFKRRLERQDANAAQRIEIEIIPGLAHLDTRDPARWWPRCFEWLRAG